jgi:penicillin-binding protein 2
VTCVPLLGRDPARRDRPIRTGRRDKPIIQLPSIALRVAVIVGIAAVMFGIVFFRLWFLQILSGEEFVAKANDNRLKPVKIVAQRGNIVDRHGEVIVENRGGQLVGIRLMDVPVGTLDQELAQLAPYLKMKPGALRRRIKDYLEPSTMELQDVKVGDSPSQAAVASATRAGGGGPVIDVTTSTSLPGQLKVGSLVDLAGLTPEAYNGLYAVTAVTDASRFQVTLPADPGADATVSSGSTVTEKAWISYLKWTAVVQKDITGVDLIPLKEDVNARIRTYVEEHALSYPGVEVVDEDLRSYPHGDLAAHVVGTVGPISAEDLESKHFKGYTGGDIVGKSGLEWTYDKWLRGRDGVAKVEVDAQGHPKQDASVPGGRMAEAGDTLVTTLDNKVQSAAEEALRTGISLAHSAGAYEANGGAAVAMDVTNGDVLAMASYPTFDPSVFVGGISTKKYNRLFVRKGTNVPQLNRAIQETKAVGSTFKAITSVAALEEGVITPGSTFWCPGYYTSPNDHADPPQKFKCWALSGHGNLALVGAITQSCDVYFYNIGDIFFTRPGEALEDWAKRLGMGKPTGIDIPGELPGRVPTPEWKKTWPYYKTEIDQLWKPSDSIYLAVGQGNLEATPLQLAVSYAAIANHGKIVTPHIGLKITDAGGRTVRDLQPTATRKVDIAQTTLDMVKQGLYDAANSPAGTSFPVFGGAGYKVQVAGKTGTAEVFDGTRIVNYAWYASYAPADDPKYVVVVMIEKGGHGATAAAPAARIIYDALFHLDSGQFTGTVQGD